MCHYFYYSIIYKSQQHSTSLWYSPKFQITIQSQPDIYSSLFLHWPTHALDPLIKLTYPLKPPHLLTLPCLIWPKLNFPLQSKNYLPVLIITMTKNMKNPKKAFLNKMKHLMQNLRSSSRPCHFISKRTIHIFNQH